MAYVPRELYPFDPLWRAWEMTEYVRDAYKEWLAAHELKDGQPLFHYTTLEGLRKILSTRSLWCGHVNSFNDPGEIEYGVNLIQEVIDEMLEGDGANETKFLHALRSQVAILFGPMVHGYVACFCENGDLLSQWRAYGDKGGGYSMGFKFSERTRIIPEPKEPKRDSNIYEDGRPPLLRKVVYDRTVQEQLVKSFLTIALDKLSEARSGSVTRLHPDDRQFADGWLATEAGNFLSDLVISFKDPAFAEEKEWRLIRVIKDTEAAGEIAFRESGGALIPYRSTSIFDVDDKASKQVDAPAFRFPLSEIVFGPTLDHARTKTAIELLNYHEASSKHPIGVDGHTWVRASAARLR